MLKRLNDTIEMFRSPIDISERQWVFGREVAKYSLQWVLMVEPSIFNVFIKINHHFVKINLQNVINWSHLQSVAEPEVGENNFR